MPFRIALSGLNAASTDLSVISNNIANASTTGFKKSRSEFADVVPAGVNGAGLNAIGAGVNVANVAQNYSQGNLEFTENVLDLAISGQGFFLQSDGGVREYSRAGQFQVDRSGYIVSNSGSRLQAFQPDTAGNITGAIGDLYLDRSDISPSATGALTSNGGISAVLNLNANSAASFAPTPAAGPSTFNPNDPATYNNSTSMSVYDSLGNQLIATMYFRQTSTPNEWEMHTYLTDNNGSQIEIPINGSTFANDPTRMIFNNDGTLASITPTVGSFGTVDLSPVDPGTGAAFLDFEIDFSGTTQFGSSFSVASLDQDGFTSGRINGISVSEDGIIQARFTNGQNRVLGQVALANFNNPQGLQQLGDTVWAETAESGAALVGAPNTSTLAAIQSGALEGSNVDLTEQLINMITAQRNFQANAQVISTADQITQTIINIR